MVGVRPFPSKLFVDWYVWQVLGETSCARTMSYLDKGMVFIGSSFGDSQVVRLQAERDESGSYVKVSLTPQTV